VLSGSRTTRLGNPGRGRGGLGRRLDFTLEVEADFFEGIHLAAHDLSENTFYRGLFYEVNLPLTGHLASPSAEKLIHWTRNRIS
jgi:hypothetical protein